MTVPCLPCIFRTVKCSMLDVEMRMADNPTKGTGRHKKDMAHLSECRSQVTDQDNVRKRDSVANQISATLQACFKHIQRLG